MIARYTFDYVLRFLLVILPFMTVLSVFTREKLGIPGFSFVKELALISLLATVVIAHVRHIHRIRWTRIDIALFAYVGVMIAVSLATTGLTGMVYGGRYDFAFLFLFFAVYHGVHLLERSISYYIKIFLISGGFMIFVSFLLKWPLSEDLLLYLGYSGNPSNWQFGSSIPIFHGVDGANVRRLQGLLDGPNTMGAFLLIYMSIFLYYFRQYREWYFVIGGILGVMIVGVFYTYSRSAALGLIGGVGLIILFLLPSIYKKYKKEFLSLVVLGILALGMIFVQYAGTMQAIVQRGGSTNGHIERMTVGVGRFLSHPLGQGLGAAGPAYRHVQNLEGKDRKEIEEIDRYHIPESWYIQQMVEGGIFGITLFLILLGLIFYRVFRRHIFLAGGFLAILIMNFFLHTFESSVVSLSLFALIALLIAPKNTLGND